jgi:hypothetical protein
MRRSLSRCGKISFSDLDVCVCEFVWMDRAFDYRDSVQCRAMSVIPLGIIFSSSFSLSMLACEGLVHLNMVFWMERDLTLCSKCAFVLSTRGKLRFGLYFSDMPRLRTITAHYHWIFHYSCLSIHRDSRLSSSFSEKSRDIEQVHHWVQVFSSAAWGIDILILMKISID